MLGMITINNNKNMADDVEKSGESNVDITLDSGLESLENPLETLQDNSTKNREDAHSFKEQSVEKEEGFCEEKSNAANGDDIAYCSENENITELDTEFRNDNDDTPEELTTVAKEQESEIKVTEEDPVLDVGEDSQTTCQTTSQTTPQVEDLGDIIFSNTSLLVSETQPEKTEFRQRNVREKVEIVEDIHPDQSSVRFDPEVQDDKETDEVFEEVKQDNTSHVTSQTRDSSDSLSNLKKLSIFKYFMAEICHGYVLELDEDKYADKRRKVHTFMKIPREVEKLMIFGFMLCLDCFLFMFTFLPVRVLVALWKLISGVFCCKKTRILEPVQICDLLKASIILVCCCLLEYLDFSVMYHTVRGQSVIKLYVIYNMLEVADRLFSSLGQDILDALFWTATEPRDRKRQHFGTIPHFAMGVGYVFLHAVLVLFQATCLNVAVNSHNKALLVILVSNQFVELKGSVFKRFERNNLFQMACSDIRERFHYLILVSIVCLRNLTEFNWNLEHLYVISPYLFATVSSEYFVDWVKHAFITKFNDIQPEVYTEYRSRLAKDATSSRQKNAHADHFDLVSRRMGFIPLPLGSLVIRVLRHSVYIHGIGAVALVITTYIFLMSVKILNSIIFLGKASQYAKEYPSTDTEPKPTHTTNTTTTTDTTQHRQQTSTESTTEQAKKPDKKPTKSLAEIDRYTLCSKEIVLF